MTDFGCRNDWNDAVMSQDDDDEAFVQAAMHLEGCGASLPAQRKRSAREIEREEILEKQLKTHKIDWRHISRTHQKSKSSPPPQGEPEAVDGLSVQPLPDVVSSSEAEAPSAALVEEEEFGPLPILPRFNEKQKQKYTIFSNRRLMLNALAEFDADRQSGMYMGPAPYMPSRGRGRGGGYRGGSASSSYRGRGRGGGFSNHYNSMAYHGTVGQYPAADGSELNFCPEE
mmetsp:Transcript_72035/g.83692  ORF Transcript_72035/g.83692 Transcript_72035/m.83692 type:complete len:228 (-) Transcript_72035:105-788(-)